MTEALTALLGDDLVELDDAARVLDVTRRTLRDPRFRRRVGLRLVKVGSRYRGVRAEDLRRVVKRERLNGGGA